MLSPASLEAYRLLVEEEALESSLRWHSSLLDGDVAVEQVSVSTLESGLGDTGRLSMLSAQDESDAVDGGDDGGGNDNGDGDENVGYDTGDSVYASTGYDLSRDQRDKNLNDEDGFDEQGWTDEEIAFFFAALSRRSRQQPDLISQDMGYSKSTGQVVQLIALFEEALSWERNNKRGASSLDASDSGESVATSHFSAHRVSRWLRRIEAAYEVSEAWEAFEQHAATTLLASDTVVSDGNSGKEQVGQCAQVHISDEFVSSEVLYRAVLFLRYHPRLNKGQCEPGKSFRLEKAVQLLSPVLSSASDGVLSLPAPSDFAYWHYEPADAERCDTDGNNHVLARSILLQAIERGLIIQKESNETLQSCSDDSDCSSSGSSAHPACSKRRATITDQSRLFWKEDLGGASVQGISPTETTRSPLQPADPHYALMQKEALRQILSQLDGIELPFIGDQIERLKCQAIANVSSLTRKRKRSADYRGSIYSHDTDDTDDHIRSSVSSSQSSIASASDLHVPSSSTSSEKASEPSDKTDSIASAQTVRFCAIGMNEDLFCSFLKNSISQDDLMLCALVDYHAIADTLAASGMAINIDTIVVLVRTLRNFVAHLIDDIIHIVSKADDASGRAKSANSSVDNVTSALEGLPSRQSLGRRGIAHCAEVAMRGKKSSELEKVTSGSRCPFPALVDGTSGALSGPSQHGPVCSPPCMLILAAGACTLPSIASIPNRTEGGNISDSDDEGSAGTSSSIYDDDRQRDLVRHRRDLHRGAPFDGPHSSQSSARLSKWHDIEAREEAEERRMADLDQYDLLQAKRCEARLWNRMGGEAHKWRDAYVGRRQEKARKSAASAMSLDQSSRPAARTGRAGSECDEGEHADEAETVLGQIFGGWDLPTESPEERLHVWLEMTTGETNG